MTQLAEYKQNFINFLVNSEVLTFGEFVTKSGRKTPYFINLGNICNGYTINELGKYYAQAIYENMGCDFDNLYGPAYKGISLVVTTSIALNELYSKNVTFTFNRKEAKSHGEKGILIGHKYQDGDRIIILEDVITAGASIDESIPLINSFAKIDLKAIVVSVDRQERGKTEKSALYDICETYNTKAFGIVTIEEIIEYLYDRDINNNVYIDNNNREKIKEYRKQYGAVT